MFEPGLIQNATAAGGASSATSSNYMARDATVAMFTSEHWPDRLWIEVMPYIVHAGTPADAARFMRMLAASCMPLTLRVLRHTITPN